MVAFTAGQRLTADALNDEFNRRRRVYQAADQSVLNSAVLVSSSDMVLSVEANSVYSVDMYLVHDANTTADFKYNLSLPTGAVAVKHSRWGGTASDTTVAAAVNRQSTDVNGYDLSGVGAGTRVTSKPSCIIVISTTAGNCTFQFAQNTANNTNATFLFAGSWIELYKLTA
jgi:hypothetical protein